MGQYLPILALLVLAIVFAAVSRVVSKLLAPRNPTAAKLSPYECGITSSTEPPERFPITFFLVAMIFIVFDIEIVFLLPWAVVFRDLGAFGYGAVVIFAIGVFESFVYLIGNGALDWGPIKKVQAPSMVGARRTSETTIRRVGMEGREASAALHGPPLVQPAAQDGHPGEAA